MIAFERRQMILRLLREQPGLKVAEFARKLDVSEGTVRNDLAVLEREQHLRRVRGGAVLLDPPPRPPPVPPIAHPNGTAKKGIARWASDLIESGETILLDASSTVLAMAPYLSAQQNLTIVTNGIEVAQYLARNPSNTVVLIGGIVGNQGQTVTGTVGAAILENLHIRTAFVSGVGFDSDMGLTEDNLPEAQLKRLMLNAAGRVVALVDSSKLGKIGLTPVASVDQIDHLFTDSDVDSQMLEEFRHRQLKLTICGENTVTTFAPHHEQRTYKIGFANLSEEIPFAVDVRKGLERAVKATSNIDLVVADNRLSGAHALDIVDNFIAKKVDLIIEYQIDAAIGTQLMNKCQRAQTPVIAVDIPMVGATYFGVNNFHSGHLAGGALGRWVDAQWGGAIDHLIVLEEPRAGALPAARIQGQLEGLFEVIGAQAETTRTFLNSGNTSEVSEEAVYAFLEAHPSLQRIAVVCFNDDAALGALQAARGLGRERDLVIVGQGADRMVRHEIRRADSSIVGSTAFMPERYGEKLIDLAMRILQEEQVPPAVYMDHVFINRDNIDLYYAEQTPNG
jgi:ribose transport system substrate-binding protein